LGLSSNGAFGIERFKVIFILRCQRTVMSSPVKPAAFVPGFIDFLETASRR